MSLEQFEAVARARRSVRHFKSDPLPEGVLERLLDCARVAPSGYNMQPTRFVVVESAEAKERLHRACFKQAQVIEAPATVVFCGDYDCRANFERIIAQDKATGAVGGDYERQLRQYGGLMFGSGPLGLGWLAKALLIPIARLVAPMPEAPVVHRRFWLAKQASLCAMNFMLAAKAAGLDTVPMEGFDPGRLRKALGLPRRWEPIIAAPVGYPADSVANHIPKGRLPLEELVRRA